MTYEAKNVSTPLPTGKLIVTNAVCHNEDGSPATDNELILAGYVKAGVGALIQAHTSALVTGVCEVKIGGVRYPQYDQRRDINVVGYTDIHPSPQTSGYMTSRNNVSSQTLDTEIPGKSTQLSLTGIQTIGEHLFKFQTHAYSTSCQIPTTSAEYVKTIHAVACLPTWLKDTETNELLPRGKFPTDGQPIKIVYSDPGLSGVVITVIEGRNARLQAAGLGLTFTNAGNIACLDNDNHCVRVGSASYTNRPCSIQACGCIKMPVIANGVYTGAAGITIVADWNAGFKEWVMSHELGHLLGLGHNDPTKCLSGHNSVMATAACNTSAAVNTAQASDGVPVAKSVYGNAGIKTCGW